MPGPVGLVGTDESAPSLADLDRDLVAACGRERPRVAIVVLGALDDDAAGWPQAASLERFRSLGAEVESVSVTDPRSPGGEAESLDASVQAIGEADIVYLAGGPRGALSRAIVASPVGDAVVAGHRRGAIVVGCASGALLLGQRQPVLRRRLLPNPIRWVDALQLLPGVVVLPAYDARPEPVMAALALLASRGSVVLGIDRDTAVAGREGAMRVYGRGRVTVWHGRHRERYRRGETFRI